MVYSWPDVTGTLPGKLFGFIAESHGALQPGKGMVSGATRRTTNAGVVGDYVPNEFLKQFMFPLTWKG